MPKRSNFLIVYLRTKAKMRVCLLVLLYGSSLISFQSASGITENRDNDIYFNPWYHVGKKKWRGPYHNRMMLTWLTAMTSAKDPQEYKKLIKRQREGGVQYIGYYYSATTSYATKPPGHHGRFPERAIPPKDVKSSWILRDPNGNAVYWYDQKDRPYLDIGKKDVQDEILSRAIRNAKLLGCNMLFLDNWAYKYFGPGKVSKEEWTEKCLSLLVRARSYTKANDMKLVVNLSSPLRYWVEFAPYLDGISYEMAAHPMRLTSQRLYEEELSSYEKVMAMEKSIFFWPDKLKKDDARWDEDGRKAVATAMLVMPKEQRYWGGIYVCSPRYEVWPVGGWVMWPEQLGKPLGPRKWEGNTVRRKFERGNISVTVGEVPQFSITIIY